MKSTRDRILQTLLYQPRTSITELAKAVGINAISVRHHLANLEADGLVTAEEERHGVGRPRLVYNLTEKGIEHFPTRYLRLTNRLLEQIKESLPKQTVDNLFSGMASDLASQYALKAKSLPLDKKLDTVKELLTQEGFSVEWEKQGDRYLIHEVSCPYYHIGQKHPEVCSVDQILISTILSIPVEQVTCVLHGDQHCTYALSGSSLEEKPT